MKRKLYNSLIEWKNDPDRKPLVLEGARQVGKTWLLKEFGKNEFDNLLYVNCHDDERMQNLFQQDLHVDRIMQALQAFSGQPIITGKTLIFIDEIQEAYRGLDSLKYFCENARDQHIVVAGSLLGVTHRPGESYPVGKVNFLYLYPMTFEEFLWAKGEEKLAEMIANCDWEMMGILDTKIQELLRQYYYVGGMPEAVLDYTTHGDVNKIRKIQKAILKTYDNDFAKHAGNETERIRLVWKSIPAQLAKENKKFVYGLVREGARAKEYETAIMWLSDCGLIHKVSRVNSVGIPLKGYDDLKAFKLFLVDVGLLGCMAGLSHRTLLDGNSLFTEFKGALTEQYVCQQLKTIDDIAVYYYTNDRGSCEIDFVIDTGNQVVPVEVKAEVNLRAKSLKTYREKFSPEICVRTSMADYKKEEWLINLPLYAVGQIASI
jgi:predicted AAA+ superfamily ATPase